MKAQSRSPLPSESTARPTKSSTVLRLILAAILMLMASPALSLIQNTGLSGNGWLEIPPAKAQQPAAEPTEEESKAAAQRAESREALKSLSDLLEARRQQQQAIKQLKSELRAAKEDVTKKEVEARLKEETDKLAQIEEQISALTSGTTEQDFYAREKEKFNLNNELQALAEPFVKMLKSTTETAREIDKLQTTITEAKRRQTIANEAISRVNTLITAIREDKLEKSNTMKHLQAERKSWSKRYDEAVSLQTTSEQQLALKEKVASRVNLESYATSFIRTRGVNLIFAIVSFFATFAILRLIGKLMSALFHKRGLQHSFYSRLTRLIYQAFIVLGSTLVMLIVLNLLNDWILLGVAGLFSIALAWIGLKMLPAIIEQAVLLLNLGAVQENERLMLNGVPWLVKRLDHYTELVNPALDGGHFALPIRELMGLHSRPAARDEAWFPTKKDDWVELPSGKIAKVVIQTPELVQLVELGGARITYATAAFIEASPRNLSTGYRITQEFGIAYKHQKDAVDRIPALLKDHITEGMSKFVNPALIYDIEVELLRAGSSSIDYDIEVDLSGKLAARYEDIEGEIIRLLIEACNIHDIEIPFPQMVLHHQRP